MTDHPRLDMFINDMNLFIADGAKLRMVKLLKEARIEFGYESGMDGLAGLKKCKDTVDEEIWLDSVTSSEVNGNINLYKAICHNAKMVLINDMRQSPWYANNIGARDSFAMIDDIVKDIKNLATKTGWSKEEIQTIIENRLFRYDGEE